MVQAAIVNHLYARSGLIDSRTRREPVHPDGPHVFSKYPWAARRFDLQDVTARHGVLDSLDRSSLCYTPDTQVALGYLGVSRRQVGQGLEKEMIAPHEPEQAYQIERQLRSTRISFAGQNI